MTDLSGRRLIFSINSGRSGSKYLAELLGTARNVQSVHEADPKMSGRYIAMINTESLESSRNERRIKAEAIEDTLRSSPTASVYAETNHTFITTFYDVVLERFQNVDVIILRRDLARVLKSFIELGYFSERNPLSLGWMSSPNAVTAALSAIAPDAELDQFDLSIAYLLDIEARGERFKREYPDVRTHEINVDDLNKIELVTAFFSRLQIKPTDSTVEICGRAVNERQKRKDKIDNPVTIEECRARLAAYEQKAAQRGIKLPPGAVWSRCPAN